MGYMLMSAPYFSLWYKYVLERFFPGNTWRNALRKVLVESLVMAPIHSSAFMVYGVLFDGGTLSMAVSKVETDLLPLWGFGLKFIPFLQVVNFRFIPARFNIFYLMGISAGWSVVLSFYVNKSDIEVAKS